MKKFKHKKYGNIYRLLFTAVDATNSHDGGVVAVYMRDEQNKTFLDRVLIHFVCALLKKRNPVIYVREKSEFNSKFTELTAKEK